MTPFSHVANHRCPRCNQLQSQFALQTTLKGGVQRLRLNTSLTCAQCKASLRLVPNPRGAGLFIWQVLRPVIFGAGYLLGFSWLVSQLSLLHGLLLPAVALFAYSVIFALSGGLLSARIDRSFFKVEVL